MSIFVVDVEATGPCPGEYSMVELGAVKINKDLTFETFYGELLPLRGTYHKEGSLKAIGKTMEDFEEYPPSYKAIRDFAKWIDMVNTDGRPMFYSDNNGFDWQFVNYYFWLFLDRNPFGHSSTNIGSLWKGMGEYGSFKKLRKTKHDHNPVNDAKGKAEALIAMKEKGLRISFK